MKDRGPGHSANPDIKGNIVNRGNVKGIEIISEGRRIVFLDEVIPRKPVSIDTVRVITERQRS